MSLKTFVKVGSITNLSDARYCAGMGADMLGFRVVEGQENFISPAAFQEIRGWVTGPTVVAEIYGLKSHAALNSILENYRPDYLELSLAELNLIEVISIPYILNLAKGDTPSGEPEYILTKTDSGIPETSVKRLIELKTGDNVDEVLKRYNIYGIALKGSQEEKPGLKDYQELAEIFEILETDD